MTIGPIQMIMVGFEKGEFEGEIFRELEMLRGDGAIRLIDMLFVHRPLEGGAFRMDPEEISLELNLQYGDLVGSLVGIKAGELERTLSRTAPESMETAKYTYGLTEEDLLKVTDRIPRGSSAAIILIEQLWAVRLAKAVRDEGGFLLAEGLITAAPLRRVREQVAESAHAAE
ncbi:MAG TPA: hypothetical protein VE134_07735 [Methanomicrobiales archaeon]|nr:hypothetical protein [Methanomicrobiales archaeon]